MDKTPPRLSQTSPSRSYQNEEVDVSRRSKKRTPAFQVHKSLQFGKNLLSTLITSVGYTKTNKHQASGPNSDLRGRFEAGDNQIAKQSQQAELI